MSITIGPLTPTMREHQRLAEIIYNWFSKQGGSSGVLMDLVYDNGKAYPVNHYREVIGLLDGKEYFFRLGDQPLPYRPCNATEPRILIRTPDDFFKWAENFQ